MRYVIRADASSLIGSGHVMRSSAIAEELISRGESVIFVGKIDDLPWVKRRITELGFSSYIEMPREFTPIVATDILILDSYDIPIDDPFIDSRNWSKIVTIVDEQTPNYFCHLRIHPGLDSNWTGRFDYPILAGPRFVPFRATLSQFKSRRLASQNSPKIAVVAGGSDPFNMVIEIAKIIAKFTEDFNVLLFSKINYKNIFDQRFEFVKIGNQLDELTQDVDLVLTTSSTSSLEFIARGLCVGVACSVDNQKQYYESLGQLNVAAQIGTRNPFGVWEFDPLVIHKLITSENFRNTLLANSIGLIDFHGAIRIVDAIKALIND